MEDRHVNWFALEKACAVTACPVCTIVGERTAKYIDNMLFEHVSDRGFRATYREAGGFCPTHSANLDSWRDGLAVAILGVDILSSFMPDLKRGKAPKRKAMCPACAESRRVEGEFLGYIAERTEEDFKVFFSASGGLCVPHYARLLSLTRRVPRWLSEFQTAAFDKLLARSSAFIECSAWGRQSDFSALPERDKVVWKELARALRGTAT